MFHDRDRDRAITKKAAKLKITKGIFEVVLSSDKDFHEKGLRRGLQSGPISLDKQCQIG